MRKLLLLPLFLLFIFSIQAQEQEEQSDSLRKNAVKIFIDCEYCDMNHIRREIPFL